jgi:hypothetical protein
MIFQNVIAFILNFPSAASSFDNFFNIIFSDFMISYPIILVDNFLCFLINNSYEVLHVKNWAGFQAPRFIVGEDRSINKACPIFRGQMRDFTPINFET